MKNGYDVIVLGLGGMGSATAYHLARRGQRVLGLDAFERGHPRGSSHGRTRIIREAYYAAPEYVPLVQRSYALWRELQAETGTPLLTITGGLLIEPPGGPMVTGAVRAAELHNLDYERLTAQEIRARYPGLRPTDDLVGVYEPHAGLLDPEACVAAHLDLANRHGAELRHAEPARRWSSGNQGVVVETDVGAYAADRLVITAGPWTSDVLPELGIPLSVERVVNVHFEPSRPELFSPDRCPIHIWEVPEGHFYALPSLPGQGMKIGRHDATESCTPETARRDVAPAEVAMLRQMLDRYAPGAAGAVKWSLTCLYTHSPDRHFVIDRLPEHDAVSFACGFSGHGFKFSSVVGEILADLALDGTTRHPIGFLAADRFAKETSS